MRLLVVDPFSGAAGDMFLGALLDMGVDREALVQGLASLPAAGWRLSAERVRRAGLAAVKARVLLEALGGGEERRGHQGRAGHGAHGRRPAELRDAVGRSGLPEDARLRALRAIDLLAQAEARVHGVGVEEVHFHEVGATDALVDICGTCLGVSLLGVERVHCRTVATGRGLLRAVHGTLPVPGPATLELLKGLPCEETDVEAELVTPTGAALLRALEADPAPAPAGRVLAAGYGAGSDDRSGRPNVLRLVLLESGGEAGAAEHVCEVRCEVDDMTPESLGRMRSALAGSAVLDLSISAVQMKKDRPGQRLTVICPEDALEEVVEVLFRHSTTFGLRILRPERRVLERETVSVETPLGPCRVKIGRLRGALVRRHPEAEDVASLAAAHGRSFEEVAAIVLAAAASGAGPAPS